MSSSKAERQAAITRLLFLSVLPVGFGTVLGVSALDVPFAGWTYGVLILLVIASTIGPYAMGWVRSLVGLLLAGIGVLWVLSIGDTPVIVRTILALALVAGITVLAWFSLRWGHVWKPVDATQWDSKGANPNFPYPYF